MPEDEYVDPAIENARSSDQLAREAAGIPDPPPSHDVNDYMPVIETEGPPSYDEMKAQIKAELLEELRGE